jgi:hypothetical protein
MILDLILLEQGLYEELGGTVHLQEANIGKEWQKDLEETLG